MEVAHAPAMSHTLTFGASAPAPQATDQMGIDMDIDLGPIDELDALQSQSTPIQSGLDSTQSQHDSVTTAPQPEANAESVAPHKLHIRGLDDLTTDHINAFTAEHFPSAVPTRVEWIDDTSANIVFSTPAIALRALESLSDTSYHGLLTELQLRPAKQFSASPDSKLEIRLAFTTDQKRPRAYEASRFYMMHPELDPREQRRKDRKKQESSGDYRRRRYGRDEQSRRRKDDQNQGFEPDMYDDDDDALAKRNRNSSSRRDSVSMYSAHSSDVAQSSHGGRSRHRLREDYPRAGARDRSMSPNKYDDNEGNNRRGGGRRRRTPPRTQDARSRNLAQDANQGKELFPSKSALGTALNGGSRELFPNKKLAANLKKELFPAKVNTSHHRRSDAFDAADETADLFERRLGFANSISDTKTILVAESSYGRLNTKSSGDSMIPETPTDSGLSIRGASKQQDQGISIRGVAADGPRIGIMKAGVNAGKELFAEKLQGRGGRRNRAEDMFY